ncbi:hypothetical protein FB471_1810 [Amycolatopsis cihanbeyliensis]|uniref:DUF5753 domain-containing protein n=1 Tax=Amycolatopsis cihanbeyliensis TaxID=1128664 RepID=A0A542DG77_AMYCI|nr:hypothetical protein FB471_1810 [Amycolatopsis cihanbeyliensis]
MRSRELGEGLRAAMERVGLNGKQAGRLLGWPQSRVSRLLSGKRYGNEIESRVRARLARQALLSRSSRCHFVFFIHEFALRLPVGGAEVMSEQLHHLLRLSVRPYVTVRVIPAAAGAHAGVAGAFMLIESAEFAPVVYLDSETSSLFLETREEVAAHRLVLKTLASTALDERESRELIAEWAIDLYGRREDHHAHAGAGRDCLAHEQLQHQ